MDPSDPDNWIKTDFWETPNWTSKGIKPKGKLQKILSPFTDRVSYEQYFVSLLRARYMDLEGDFRTIIPPYILDKRQNEFDNVRSIADYIVDLLLATRDLLEREKLEKVDLLSGSSLLDEIEQCMVWIAPLDIELAQIKALHLNLDKLKSPMREEYKSILGECKSEIEEVLKSKLQNG